MRYAIVTTSIVAVAVAVGVIALSSGDDDHFRSYDTTEPFETSVRAIVEVPPQWMRKPVTLKGTAVPVPGGRFVLRGGQGRSIIVRPEPGSISGALRPGDRVTVTGMVNAFSRLQVRELRRLAATRGGALTGAPIELSDPYISADRVAA